MLLEVGEESPAHTLSSSLQTLPPGHTRCYCVKMPLSFGEYFCPVVLPLPTTSSLTVGSQH